MRVGLIGVGLLGSALGERFVNAGFAVKLFDTSPDRLRALVTLGAQTAHSAREVAAFSDVIVLCLPDSRVSSAVLIEIGGELKITQADAARMAMPTTTPATPPGRSESSRAPMYAWSAMMTKDNRDMRSLDNSPHRGTRRPPPVARHGANRVDDENPANGGCTAPGQARCCIEEQRR